MLKKDIWKLIRDISKFFINNSQKEKKEAKKRDINRWQIEGNLPGKQFPSISWLGQRPEGEWKKKKRRQSVRVKTICADSPLRLPYTSTESMD